MSTTGISILAVVLLVTLVGSSPTEQDGQAFEPVFNAHSFEQQLKPPSELALLMRTLAVHADSVKATLGKDGSLPPYPSVAANLNTAIPTEGMHIDPITYPTFANDYLNKLDLLYKAKKKERASAYNALVLGCANCHTTHCPGPMMRIKKMYVPIGDK